VDDPVSRAAEVNRAFDDARVALLEERAGL
jgi:hypothetical protein